MQKMMKKFLIYLLYLGVLIVISGCVARTPLKYFKRPHFNNCITMLKPGYMACNGKPKKIPPRMTIPETTNDFNDAFNYYEDKEYRLYLCLKHKRCN